MAEVSLDARSVPRGHRVSSESLRLLSEMAQEFTAAIEDPAVLLQLVARRVSEAFGDLCVIRLVSADGRALDSEGAVHHPDPGIVAIARRAIGTYPQRVGEGFMGRIAETGEAALVPLVDARELLASLDPPRADVVTRLTITSLVGAPLVARARVVGVVTLARADAGRPYGEEDLFFLKDLAAHAALAIANARFYAAERASSAEARRAVRALRESKDTKRFLFEASPVPLLVFDAETLEPLAVNDAALGAFGYERDEFLRLHVSDLVVLDREPRRDLPSAWGDAEVAGLSLYRRRDGSQFVGEYTTQALRFAGRRARIGAIKDVTDRHEAEKAHALLASIVQSSNDAIVSKGLDGRITSWNGAAERLFGWSAAEAVGRPITMTVPEDRLGEERKLMEAVARGERIDQYQTVRVRKDGRRVDVAISLSPVLDASGHVVGASKTVRDLTAQREGERTLRRTEEQLRGAQKLDAMGRLAGGIAHDFNNLLSVVLSYSELLLEGTRPEDPARPDLEEIRKAAVRAADLTGQLLAFSRHQVVEPRVLDLNVMLTGLDRMLHRVLGEDIDLVSKPAPDLGRILADPSHIDQVVLNLVVNARDAMPRGGQLTLETRNVDLDERYARDHIGAHPGPHVMLAVTDTGCGMEAATVARIFEPFFTTKKPGKGTGLGLSTVFGIVQQAGGSVWVYSEPGRGSTFKVYLPRVDAAVDELGAAPVPATVRGTETILLVEDNDPLRAVARSVLRRNGYDVMDVASAAEAIRVSAQHAGTIHLLLTDVVMPQMSGPELAVRLAGARPGMKVLCMSGYTDDSVVRHGVLEPHHAFLQKPITPESLALKVRAVLDARG